MMTKSSTKPEMRTSPQEDCPLCGCRGDFRYREQKDRLFSAPGRWDIKECANFLCGLLWLDPMPVCEDLGKAYANYYTHEGPAEPIFKGLLGCIYTKIKRGHLANAFGYYNNEASPTERWLGMLLYFMPWRRCEVRSRVRTLPALSEGKLLDVGCGSGEWMAFMHGLGWQVQGVDFDKKAVEVANLNCLNVQCGSLEEQCFPAEHFDAVILHHVIEHVPDPVKTLKECFRILKKGGTLALFTPNSCSIAHRLFKRDWRGLEPPRHLHIFNPASMQMLLAKAGFGDVPIRTANARYIWINSLKLWQGRAFGSNSSVGARVSALALTVVLTMFEQVCLVVNCNAGECLEVHARKR